MAAPGDAGAGTASAAQGVRGRAVAARLKCFRTAAPAAKAARDAEAPLPDRFWWCDTPPEEEARAFEARHALNGATPAAETQPVSSPSPRRHDAHGAARGAHDATPAGPAARSPPSTLAARVAALRARRRSWDAPAAVAPPMPPLPPPPQLVGWARVERTSRAEDETEADDEAELAHAAGDGAADDDDRDDETHAADASAEADAAGQRCDSPLSSWRASRPSDADTHAQSRPPCSLSPSRPPATPSVPHASPLFVISPVIRGSRLGGGAALARDGDAGTYDTTHTAYLGAAAPPSGPPLRRPSSAAAAAALLLSAPEPDPWTGGWRPGGAPAVDELLSVVAAFNAALRREPERASSLFAELDGASSGLLLRPEVHALAGALVPTPLPCSTAAGLWALLDADEAGALSLPALRAGAAAAAAAAAALQAGTPPLRKLGAFLEANMLLVARAFEAEGGAARRLPPLGSSRLVTALCPEAPPSELRALALALLACSARAQDGLVSLVDTLRAALGGAPPWLTAEESKRREGAAATLQRRFRAHHVRRAQAAERATQHDAARALQTAARGMLARRQVTARRAAKAEADAAAAAQEAAQEAARRALRCEAAARVMQTATRRWLTSLRAQRGAAAVAIQAAVRGRLGRARAAAERAAAAQRAADEEAARAAAAAVEEAARAAAAAAEEAACAAAARAEEEARAAAAAAAEAARAAEALRAQEVARAAGERFAAARAQAAREAADAERARAERAAAAVASAWSSDDDAAPPAPTPSPPPAPHAPAPLPPAAPAGPSHAARLLASVTAAAQAAAVSAQASAAECARHEVIAVAAIQRDCVAQLSAALAGGAAPRDPALAALAAMLTRQLNEKSAAAAEEAAAAAAHAAQPPPPPPPPPSAHPPLPRVAFPAHDAAAATSSSSPPRLRFAGGLAGAGDAAAAVSRDLDALLQRLSARAAGIQAQPFCDDEAQRHSGDVEEQSDGDACTRSDGDGMQQQQQQQHEQQAWGQPHEAWCGLSVSHGSGGAASPLRLSGEWAAWEEAAPHSAAWRTPSPAPTSAAASPQRVRTHAQRQAPQHPAVWAQPDWADTLPRFVSASLACAPQLVVRADGSQRRRAPSPAATRVSVQAACSDTWRQYAAVFGGRAPAPLRMRGAVGR
jgi:hypothetical protein